MILKLLEKYQNEDFGNCYLNVVWGPVLPQDMSRVIADEQVMVQTGMHSRHRAMSEIGINNPEQEFSRWLEERQTILRMNKELNARSVRNRASERVEMPLAEGNEE